MIAPQPRTDSVRIFILPIESQLAAGWRAELVAILKQRSLHEVPHAISQFAELCRRREPDTTHDPLDCAAPVHRRINLKNRIRYAEELASGRQWKKKRPPILVH